MQDVIAVQVVDGLAELADHRPGLFLGKALPLLQQFVQLTIRAQLHQQVNVTIIVEVAV